MTLVHNAFISIDAYDSIPDHMRMVELRQISDFSYDLAAICRFWRVQLDGLDGINALIQLISHLHHRPKTTTSNMLQFLKVRAIPWWPLGAASLRLKKICIHALFQSTAIWGWMVIPWMGSWVGRSSVLAATSLDVCEGLRLKPIFSWYERTRNGALLSLSASPLELVMGAIELQHTKIPIN